MTTEALLRDALEREDAHELFSWLRELSFMESGPDGVFPHDLARDALEADLRWRDPEGYKRVFRGVRAQVQRRLTSTSGREQQRAILDAKFLFRRLPGVLSPVDWDIWGHHAPSPPGRETGSRSSSWSWNGRVRSRRRSPRDGGSGSPRASSWSGASTARSPASSPWWT